MDVGPIMTRSDAIDALGTALATAQAAMVPAKKDSSNPHFRSRYADLASIWDACRSALTTAGLSVLQSPRLVPVGVELETLLIHTSGQWVADTLTIPVATPTAQAVGSAITYGRRYALAAFVGVAPDDDDGHDATARRPATRVDQVTGELYDAPVVDQTTFRDAPPQSEDRPTVETVTVHILDVKKRQVGDDKKWKYTILADDGQNYQTWSKATAARANEARETSTRVELVYSVTKWGRDLQTLRAPDSREPGSDDLPL